MSLPALLRMRVPAAVVLSTLAAVLSTGALLAPAAQAGEPTPPGLHGPALSSAAPAHAVPLGDSLGRKLR